MMTYPQLTIKKDRIVSINRRHPWIFSRGVKDAGGAQDGDIVEVVSPAGDYLATGYYQDGSIMVRILSFEQCSIDRAYWIRRLTEAYKCRRQVALPSETTNAYRLCHGEGDGVSGLIIDIYNHVAVIQCHTIGIHRLIDDIAHAIRDVLPDIESIYDKSSAALPQDYACTMSDGHISGAQEQVTIDENGHQFVIDLVNSQKTGFFLDQRDNRELLSTMAKGRSVLNLYCYTGGFSIYALDAGAEHVVSIDASKKAIEMVNRNVELCGGGTRHESIVADVNRYLGEIDADTYDIIIVDPPAFAKSIRKRHNAVQAYKRVNAAAIRKVKSGGMIFTFSCSQVIDQALFYNTITAAAIESGRSCRVIHHLSQGADHPVNIYHPEGKYLKGLVLQVQ